MASELHNGHVLAHTNVRTTAAKQLAAQTKKLPESGIQMPPLRLINLLLHSLSGLYELDRFPGYPGVRVSLFLTSSCLSRVKPKKSHDRGCVD